MIHMYIEIDVDDNNYLYHKLIVNTCILSIGCKPNATKYFNVATT
jgi:hypothetical protein